MEDKAASSENNTVETIVLTWEELDYDIEDEESCEDSSGDEIHPYRYEPQASDTDEEPATTSDAGAAAEHGSPKAGLDGNSVLSIPMDISRLQNTEWWDLILTKD